MRILFCVFDDYMSVSSVMGGITGHTEHLAYGFKELGHEVSLRIFRRNPTTIVYPQKIVDKFTWTIGAFGLPTNTNLGWCVPEEQHVDVSKSGVEQFREVSAGFDLIIWEQMCLQDPKFYADREILDTDLLVNKCSVNLGLVHAGNAGRTWGNYVDFMERATKVGTRFVNVHPFSDNSTPSHIPHKFIPNPFDVSQRVNAIPLEEREIGWLACQRFLSSKRIDKILRASCHMKADTTKILAGDGFERYCLQKPVDYPKFKPFYAVGRQWDPDCREEDIGRTLWDVSQENGVRWQGKINGDTRDGWIKQLRGCIDASYYLRTVRLGEIFHRATIEPMTLGAIPFYVYLRNVDHTNYLLKPNENYIGIPQDCTPKEFETIVDNGLRNLDEACRRLKNNDAILPLFDRKNIAQRFIQYANGDSVDIYAERCQLQESVRV